MTKPNPLARVTLSRQTLYKFREMPNGTGDEPEWLLKQVGEEIAILEQIARDVPKIAESIGLLIEAWQDFAGKQKQRAH